MTYGFLNPVFFLFLALSVTLFFVFDRLVARAGASSEKVFLLLSFLPLIAFAIHKILISFDADYIAYYYNGSAVNYWDELPLYPCTIAMILLPVSIAMKKTVLCGAMSVVGIAGSIFTLISPFDFMSLYPFTKPMIFFYFAEHLLLLVVCLLAIKLRIARLEYSLIPKHILLCALCLIVVAIINMILRATGLLPKANYCFAYGLEGNPLMDYFYHMLPVPFVFPFCMGLFFVAVFDVLLTFLVKRMERISVR